MRRAPLRQKSFTTLVLVLIATSIAGGAGPRGTRFDRSEHKKLDRYLQQVDRLASPDDRIRVIVTARKGAGDHVKSALIGSDGAIVHEHKSIEAVTADVPAGRLRSLAQREDVIAVSIDAPVHAGADAIGTLADNQLLPTLGLNANTDVGKDVGVAVLDSGILNHEQLPLAAFYDFANKGGAKVKQYDDYGHGTHVAAVIKAKDDKSDARYRSVAHGARLIGMKVLAGDGSGYTSTVIDALEFAIANKSKLKIDVINLSLGHPIYEPAATDPLVQAVERAVDAGIVVVVAAGNEGMNRETGEVGYAGITSPGNAPSAISVGAVDTKNTLTRGDDEVAAFSSRGPTWYDGYAKPDVVAPGRRVVSLIGKDSYLTRRYPQWTVTAATRTYMALSGTSMATAVATGVVADIIAASRDASGGESPTPNTVKAILEFTAVQLANVDVLTQGAGSINARGALALASAIDTRTSVSSPWLALGVTPSTTLSNGEVLDWAQHIVWGDHVVWGNYVYFNEPAWALHVVWGNHIVWGDHVVWGNAFDSVVWGTTQVWGTHVVWGASVIGYDANGTLLYGDQIDWGTVAADHVVWGALDSTLSALDALDTLWSPVF
jgi:serine protease AprX